MENNPFEGITKKISDAEYERKTREDEFHRAEVHKLQMQFDRYDCLVRATLEKLRRGANWEGRVERSRPKDWSGEALESRVKADYDVPKWSLIFNKKGEYKSGEEGNYRLDVYIPKPYIGVYLENRFYFSARIQKNIKKWYEEENKNAKIPTENIECVGPYDLTEDALIAGLKEYIPKVIRFFELY